MILPTAPKCDGIQGWIPITWFKWVNGLNCCQQWVTEWTDCVIKGLNSKCFKSIINRIVFWWPLIGWVLSWVDLCCLCSLEWCRGRTRFPNQLSTRVDNGLVWELTRVNTWTAESGGMSLWWLKWWLRSGGINGLRTVVNTCWQQWTEDNNWINGWINWLLFETKISYKRVEYKTLSLIENKENEI